MRAEAEQDVQVLLDKLDRWLLVQPEWVRLMGLPERNIRKRVAHLVAEELLLMPVSPGSAQPGRERRRAIMRELEKSKREWFRGTDALGGSGKAEPRPTGITPAPGLSSRPIAGAPDPLGRDDREEVLEDGDHDIGGEG